MARRAAPDGLRRVLVFDPVRRSPTLVARPSPLTGA